MARGGIFKENIENDIGKKYGRLTVQNVFRNEKGNIMYDCKCDCGNQKIFLGANVVSGKTKSCGCYRNEQVRKSNYIGNRYEEKDEYIIGYTTKNEKFYIDKEDLELIKPYTWSFNNTGYLRANVNRNTGTRMHRFILGLDKNDKRMVDHINHDKRDNRKSNLRICSNKENSWNASPSKSSKSGIPGVNWDKRYNKWAVYLTKDGKRKFYGYYKNLNDAIEKRKQAELESYQEYGYNYSKQLSPRIN